MEHGWVCNNCRAAGIEEVQPEDATRCTLCEEPRRRKTALQSVVTSFGRVHSQSSSPSSSSRQASPTGLSRMASDVYSVSSSSNSWMLDSPAATEQDNRRILEDLSEDLSEAKSSFGDGSVRWERVDSGIVIQFYFRPFERGRPESLPEEACRAWGLEKVFAPVADVESSDARQVREDIGNREASLRSLAPSSVMLRLTFESTSAYHSRTVRKSQLFFVRDSNDMSAPGDQRDAHDNGCRVAKQLERIAKSFFDKGASKEKEVRRQEEEGLLEGAMSLEAGLPEEAEDESGQNSTSQEVASTMNGAAQVQVVPVEEGGRRENEGILRQSDSRTQSREEAEVYKGVMAQTYSYLAARLQTLNEYCAICDEPHTLVSMIQPSVCTRPLCIFSFAEFGRLVVSAEGHAAHAGVVLELLVATSTLAAKSARAEDIFEPFPRVARQQGSDELALDPAKKKDHLPIVREVLSNFPAFEKINAHALENGESGVQALMQEHHPLCYPLFEWIRSSNRSHLESVPFSNQLARVKTRHQFVMLSAPPERQARFDQLKAQYKTTFAWHGSPPENWHGILRYGLKNASNTNLMLNGASKGNGIYLSPEGALSMSYCGKKSYCDSHSGMGYRDARAPANPFLDSSNLRLLALCEVALVPSLRKFNSVWVAPQEESVITRFLFAYPHGLPSRSELAVQGSELSTQAPGFEEEVRACWDACLLGLKYR